MIIEILLGLILAIFTWSMVAMEINYRRASTMGIPLVRLPVDPINLAWILTERPIFSILDRLPINWGTFGRYARRGWHFKDKSYSHVKYGPIWAHVTPSDIYVSVADPEAIHNIFMRRGDFLRPSKMYKLLEVYGPCISTADWANWPRHRKVLAQPFNESIMKFVWDESLDQARDMLQSWTRNAAPGYSFAKDTRCLSLDVLAATGFRRSYPFRSSSKGSTDEAATYRDALQTVLDNALPLMLVPPKFLNVQLLPKSWRRIGKAAADFKRYMQDMLEEETSRFEQGKPGSGGLMTSFVRALNTNQKEDKKEDTTPGVPKGLSINEIFGNIFVINFAGHDTTANTLAFCMILLAANPDVQEWVGEELQEILGNFGDQKWDYNELFPKLKRCLAVLLETLRLYPPIMALPKWSNEFPQTLQVGEQTVVIPPQTGVSPGLLAIQTHPKYWTDPLTWKPSRWILSSSKTPDLPKQLAEESIFTPVPGSYFPWSDGPQNCPGAKFAQVEFVAVLACLLKGHRVGVVRGENESDEHARKRALAVTEDCDMELLLRMRDPDKVRLEWKEM